MSESFMVTKEDKPKESPKKEIKFEICEFCDR